MSISVADFLRLLPQAAPAVLISTHQASAVAADEKVRISWQALPEKSFASLTMPQLEVTLEFEQCADAKTKAFIAHFERIYQRGGG